MGNACCGRKEKRRKIVMLLLGLDNAGKTVAAKGLAGESIDDVVPTVGFHIVKLKYKHFSITIYDLGGAANFRNIWPKYFADAHGVIFVIDSSDFTRLNEAEQVLESVVSHNRISGKPLLILANKQDSENALDEIDLNEKINLERMVNIHKCPTLLECCAATDQKGKSKIDEGISRGFKWLISFIDKNYEQLNVRVVGDIIQQEQKEKELREKIMNRIQESQKLSDTEDKDAIELYSEYKRKLKNESSNILDPVKKVDENSAEFPPLYYGTVKVAERPKSARDFVKDQIRLNCNGTTVKKNNRTQPLQFIGAKLPNSAKQVSRTSVFPRRLLKSANDIERRFNLPNMTMSDKDVFDHSEGVLDFEKSNGNAVFYSVDLSPKVKICERKSMFNSDDDLC